MSAAVKNISHNRKILLVGDLSRAFSDISALKGARSEICADMDEAIDIAAENSFAVIAIVMSGISAGLSSDLKALRDNCSSKIVLLARMYEEPIAIRLVDSTYNGTSLADDYLICPLVADKFYESVMTPTGEVAAGPPPSAPAAIDTTTETRIRVLERLATEDDLTALKNRRYIWEFSRQIIDYARNQNGRVTLLVFDIDDFKHYNDVYGHCTGDEILKQAAVLMRRCCRSHDVVGRIGGDEFAVIFWDDPQEKRTPAPTNNEDRRSANADHPAEAITIAKRFVRELSKAEFSALGELGPEGKGVLTISGGLASFPRDGDTIEDLFQQADKALLEAKRSGKNRIYLVGKPQSNITEID